MGRTPFDDLQDQQNDLRRKSIGYEWWIKSGFLSVEEKCRLIEWYMRPAHQGVVDLDGIQRCKLVRQLPTAEILRFIDLNNIESYPRTLRKYLKKRFSAIRSSKHSTRSLL